MPAGERFMRQKTRSRIVARFPHCSVSQGFTKRGAGVSAAGQSLVLAHRRIWLPSGSHACHSSQFHVSSVQDGAGGGGRGLGGGPGRCAGAGGGGAGVQERLSCGRAVTTFSPAQSNVMAQTLVCVPCAEHSFHSVQTQTSDSQVACDPPPPPPIAWSGSGALTAKRKTAKKKR